MFLNQNWLLEVFSSLKINRFCSAENILIVSAGFLILSADAIRKSADSLIVSALKKAGWGALSLSCEDLWLSWEGESENSVDIFKPPPPPP